MIGEYIKQDEEYVKRFGNNTIFLIQCGSFYEVYSCKKNGTFLNTRINDFSKICNDMRIADKKSKYKGLSVYMCGFPEIYLEKYVKRLTDAGWTVCVHSQDPTCPKIRKELGIFSPGTNFNAVSDGKNRIMCIWLEHFDKTTINKNSRIVCGISCIDIISGDVYTYQGIENYFHNPTTFDELERFYCSYSPTELIIIHNFNDKKINDIISFVDIDADLIHKFSINNENEWSKAINNCSKQTYQEQELTKYYKIFDYEVFCESHSLREREISTASLIFLLNFLDYHSKDLVNQLKEPVFTNVKDRVRLANHSLKQLNIIDVGKKSKYSSLLSLVNKCKTSMGKRYLEQKLLNPTINETYLNKEYDILKYVMGIDTEDSFKLLDGLSDFERLFRKIVLNRVTPSDLSNLYHNLSSVKKIHRFVSKNPILDNYMDLFNLSNSINILQSKIVETLDIKKSDHINCRDFDVNIFKKGINVKLDEAEFNHLDVKQQLESMRSFLDKQIIDKATKNKDKVHIHQTDKSGIFLITTKTRAKKLLKALQSSETHLIKYTVGEEEREIILDIQNDPIREGTASGNNVRLDCTLLNRIYHRYSQTKSNLKEILMHTFRTFVERFSENKSDFEVLIKYITKYDFLLTRAYIAKTYNYTCPVIQESEQSFVDAKDIRHPLIEQIQEGELYVPNDVSLGKDHTGILLFGTNAVGKSSLIRSIGMSVILAQSGFFVPCSSFVFKPYREIFTRILGNDDIFKGLSTFAVEMSELSCILKSASHNSLVLGDELCSGTETTSALCIFTAGVMMLHKVNTSFIFATHFHEVIENQEIKDLGRLSLQHMVVKYDTEKQTLIYDRKIRNGAGNKLYGLEVCKSLSMPQEFLHIANHQPTILNSNKSRYNSNKLRYKCEFCDNNATEIHHMRPQEDAIDGYIGPHHKNHKANLCSICKECHLKITKNKIKHTRVKTGNGSELYPIS
jgi:DNA mismatch repair protein MutS